MTDFSAMFRDMVNINKIIVDQKIHQHPPLSEGMKVDYNKLLNQRLKALRLHINLREVLVSKK